MTPRGFGAFVPVGDPVVRLAHAVSGQLAACPASSDPVAAYGVSHHDFLGHGSEPRDGVRSRLLTWLTPGPRPPERFLAGVLAHVASEGVARRVQRVRPQTSVPVPRSVSPAQ